MKALPLLTVMEVARRVLGQQAGEAPLLNRADLVAAHCQAFTAGLAVENFWVLCLNRKNRLVKRVEITSGIATAPLVHPREFFGPQFRSRRLRSCASATTRAALCRIPFYAASRPVFTGATSADMRHKTGADQRDFR